MLPGGGVWGHDDTACWRPWGVGCRGAAYSSSPPRSGLGPPAYPGVRLGAYLSQGGRLSRSLPRCILLEVSVEECGRSKM
ncbi:MAG: hypothetical protein QW724_02570 [Nitrososphaerota archaeon]